MSHALWSFSAGTHPDGWFLIYAPFSMQGAYSSGLLWPLGPKWPCGFVKRVIQQRTHELARAAGHACMHVPHGGPVELPMCCV